MSRRDNYYIDDETPRATESAIPIKRIRYQLSHQIVVSEILPFHTDTNGLLVQTNLYDIALALASDEILVGYAGGAPIARYACEDLARDGFAAQISPTAFQISHLKRKDVVNYNRIRFPTEFSLHCEAIRRIWERKDDEFRPRLLGQFRNALSECELSLGKGKGFRDADRRFHNVVFPTITQDSFADVMAACDQSYMKMRHLAKFIHGPGSPEYLAFMIAYNSRQLETLLSIYNEYERSKPRMTALETALRNHTNLQIDAWELCQEMIGQIKMKGDAHDLGC